MTLVSVLTPSFQYGRFLRDCLDSVAAQAHVAVEHVVQDGGSTDETHAILEQQPDVSWVSEEDAGQSDALNRALARASGDWVAWLNVDEFYLPDALAAAVEHATMTGADVVYGDTSFCDEAGRLERLVPQHRFHERVLLEYGTFISSASVLIRREVLGDRPWDVTATGRMDWDLYLRLARSGATFEHLRRPVGAFRRHDDQVTAGGWEPNIDEENALAARHGMSADRHERYREARWGRRAHGLLKVTDGAYVRQRRARGFVGQSLRWFADATAAATVRDYIVACSGRGAPFVPGTPS